MQKAHARVEELPRRHVDLHWQWQIVGLGQIFQASHDLLILQYNAEVLMIIPLAYSKFLCILAFCFIQPSSYEVKPLLDSRSRLSSMLECSALLPQDDVNQVAGD